VQVRQAASLCARRTHFPTFVLKETFQIFVLRCSRSRHADRFSEVLSLAAPSPPLFYLAHIVGAMMLDVLFYSATPLASLGLSVPIFVLIFPWGTSRLVAPLKIT